VEASGAGKQEIVKEVVDLSFRQTGILHPTVAEPTMEGINVAGRGALEEGDSDLVLWGKPGESGVAMEEVVHTPFPCYGRPSAPATGVLHITNRGTASHTVCGVDLQQDQFLGGFAVSDA